MVGREREKNILIQALKSNKSEFVVIYGRRRVGKTYLIKEFFKNNFSFYSTGSSGLKTKEQLKGFFNSLKEYDYKGEKCPKDWFEAFSMLKSILVSNNAKRDSYSGKKIVFIDELPWLDTARSDFKSALDYFWNSYASFEKDVVLIVCGSASSWIISNLLKSTGGFYNRITRIIRLEPFTLNETKLLCNENGLNLSNHNLLNLYMIFGGIPFYINCLDNRLSLAQNIDSLILNETGQLHYEYSHLYHSLFKNAELHLQIIEMLSKVKYGVTRNDLISKTITGGKQLTIALEELEQCGFIRKYNNFLCNKNNCFYQLIDPFTLFYINFVKSNKTYSWVNFLNSPGYYTWQGNAFEIVCLLHINKIKEKLGIAGIESHEYSWRDNLKNGAQIDLIIDRKDDAINLCEIKCSNDAFVIDDAYKKNLINKINRFYENTKTKKDILLTFISFNGLENNENSEIIKNIITGEDLIS